MAHSQDISSLGYGKEALVLSENCLRKLTTWCLVSPMGTIKKSRSPFPVMIKFRTCTLLFSPITLGYAGQVYWLWKEFVRDQEYQDLK